MSIGKRLKRIQMRRLKGGFNWDMPKASTNAWPICWRSSVNELLRQYELFDANSESRLVCWLEADRRLKIGTRLTLKGINTDWIVMRIYKTERTASDVFATRHWKVGGLA